MRRSRRASPGRDGSTNGRTVCVTIANELDDDEPLWCAVFARPYDKPSLNDRPAEVVGVAAGAIRNVAIPEPAPDATADEPAAGAASPPNAAPLSCWLSIAQGSDAGDGVFHIFEISTTPHEVAAGRTATIGGSMWRGFSWSVE